jgi:PAS domain S-box-containing protein
MSTAWEERFLSYILLANGAKKHTHETANESANMAVRSGDVEAPPDAPRRAMADPTPTIEEIDRLRAEVVELRREVQRGAGAEAALRESEALLRSVLKGTPFPVGTTDREGNITFLSHTANTLPVEEYVGQPLWKFVVPRDQIVAKDAIARVVSTGESVTFEVTVPSGRMYSISAGPLRREQEIVGVTMVSRDITKQKELEARLAVADRMAAIGTLAAGVAHEINNPLTYVLASLEQMKAALPAGPEGTELRSHLGAATEGAQRVRNIVSDLSSFSHAGDGPLMSLDVRPMLESALRMAHTLIHTRARVVRALGNVPAVRASDSRLGQVFLNLIVNAAHAISEGDVEGNEIRVTTRTDEHGRAVVEVADTGTGIAEDLQRRIFDPFVTTKPRGAGMGLGLYICRNIVGSLGGELEVESALGKGSTFRVVLPGAGPAPRSLPSDGAMVGLANGGTDAAKRLRILVVDDEPKIGNVLRALLADHDVTVVHGGHAALEALCERRFDLALCDLSMPDLGGAEVHDRLRSLRPGAEECLVFMTGGAFTEEDRRFLERVASRVLTKPFTAEELRSIVARHSAYTREDSQRDGEAERD